LSNLPGGYLDVLLAKRGSHVSGGKVARRQPDWIKPQPHGIFALAKDNDAAYALHALDGVAHVKVKIVADEKVVVLFVSA